MNVGKNKVMIIIIIIIIVFMCTSAIEAVLTSKVCKCLRYVNVC